MRERRPSSGLILETAEMMSLMRGGVRWGYVEKKCLRYWKTWDNYEGWCLAEVVSGFKAVKRRM